MHIRQLLIFSVIGLVGLGLVGYKLKQKSGNVSEDFTLNTGREAQSDIAEIRVSQSLGNQLLLQLDMSFYKRAQFAIMFHKEELKGTCLNIGDSPTNDGWGGDAGQSSHNAELQVLGPSGGLLIYGSDEAEASSDESSEEKAKSQLLKGAPALVKPEETLLIEVANGSVSWKAGKGAGEKLEAANLFALNNQPDAKNGGKNDNLIFAAFNRAIGSPQVQGTCVSGVKVTLMRQ